MRAEGIDVTPPGANERDFRVFRRGCQLAELLPGITMKVLGVPRSRTKRSIGSATSLLRPPGLRCCRQPKTQADAKPESCGVRRRRRGRAGLGAGIQRAGEQEDRGEVAKALVLGGEQPIEIIVADQPAREADQNRCQGGSHASRFR
jgi:hypothetical protein